MNNREVARQHQRLESLIKNTLKASNDDLNLQAHWARYLCILVAGFLENALKEIYSEYIKSKASKPIADYAVSNLMSLQNPKANKFLELAGAFQREWRDSLELFIQENGRKDAIDSIMKNRHEIAHGKDTGITIARIDTYLKRSVEVVEFIETQCQGSQLVAIAR
jgi:hypothetical protein